MTTIRSTEELVKIDRELIIHPMTPIRVTWRLILEEGSGVIVKDTEGKEYIDFNSGFVMACNLGYGHKEIAEAIKAQVDKLSYAPQIYGLSHKVGIECAEKLKEVTPDGINHFFFGSGGSDANDAAFKTARTYWRNKGKGKLKIISLHNSYHGANSGTVHASGVDYGSLWKDPESLTLGFIHIPNYHCYRCEFGLKYPECDTRCARFLAQIIENEGEDSVAAFIAEPVQGAGGVILPPPTYWPLVRQICTEHNVLLIADEVITGFGRTGKMFAVEHWGVTPDIITMAKGITSAYFPFSATGVTDEVFEGLAISGGSFPVGYTHSGHPVGCAAASAVIDIYAREKIVENAAKMGEYLLARAREFSEFDHVDDIGGLGLMVSFELVADKATKARYDHTKSAAYALIRRLRPEGILIRATPDRIVMAPALIITKEQIDRVIDAIKPELANLSAS